MLHSANEAATMLAEHISGSQEKFAKLMNEKAKEIGCKNTNFVNANGMHNENHYSTAYDMALIAKYCMEDERFREIVTLQECSLPSTPLWDKEERVFKNTNNLMIKDNRYYYPYCNGIKTGFTTPAKNCMISSANKDGFELIAVVLHAEATDENLSARYLDTINLFNYGFNNFNLESIQKEYGISGVVRRGKNDTLKEVQDDKKEENIIEEKSQEENVVSKLEEKFDKDLVMLISGIAILVVVFLIKIIFFTRKKVKGKHSFDDMYKFKYNL